MLIVFLITSSFSLVFGVSELAFDGGGTASQGSGAGRDTTSSGSDDFWNKATDWFSNVDKDEELGTGVKDVVNTFSNMISVVGTTVFVIVTIFLGIKYMLGSVEEKASYKKTLLPFIIGAAFIFAASTIATIVYNVAINL